MEQTEPNEDVAGGVPPAARDMEDAMGRPPIKDEAMSAAERQRRRRERLRREPWSDPRAVAWSLLEALRALRAGKANPIDDAATFALVEKAVAAFQPEDEDGAEAAREAVLRLLDPSEPLPVRGHGHHGHGHGHHHGGHRFGDRMRERHRRRHGRHGEDPGTD